MKVRNYFELVGLKPEDLTPEVVAELTSQRDYVLVMLSDLRRMRSDAQDDDHYFDLTDEMDAMTTMLSTLNSLIGRFPRPDYTGE